MRCFTSGWEIAPMARSCSLNRARLPLMHAVSRPLAVLLGLMLAAVLSAARLHAGVVELFEERELSFKVEGNESDVLRYRLFVPDHQGADKQLPLIVWLHGHGENGRDNAAQLKWLDWIFRDPSRRSQYRFYVLAPQWPKDGQADSSPPSPGRASDHDMIEAVRRMIDRTIAEERIDDSRITVAGVSAGGNATWQIVSRFPTRFAGAAPMGSAAVNQADIANLMQTPTWAFFSQDDPPELLSTIRLRTAEVAARGGTIMLTETQGMGHDCWTEAFRDHAILEWLLRQQRGVRHWAVRPGGYSVPQMLRWLDTKWTWQQLTAQALVFAAPASLMAWMLLRKSRGRSRPQAPGDDAPPVGATSPPQAPSQSG